MKSKPKCTQKTTKSWVSFIQDLKKPSIMSHSDLLITQSHLKLLEFPKSLICCREFINNALLIVCNAFCGFNSFGSIVLLPVICDNIFGRPANDEDDDVDVDDGAILVELDWPADRLKI